MPQPQPCGLCGDPCYTGPEHPCCRFWAAELAEGRVCPACSASRAAARTRNSRRPSR